MDQTGDQYLEFKEELQDVMAATLGEIKPELAEEFEWRTYVQRYPGTCLLAGGALDPRQKLLPTVSRCSSTAEKSSSRISAVPRKGGQVVALVLAEAVPLAAKLRI